MKKLPMVLKPPTRVVTAVGLIVMAGEFLIMLLIELIQTTALKDSFLGNVDWRFVDPIVLTAIVSPALYFLIFRPLNQQAELERRLDELRRFQNVTVGRELRMKELMEENTSLRNPLSAGPAGAIPVTSGYLEAARHAAEQPAATQPTEQSQRSALLFMLEDLENSRRKVEQAHQEWMAALDVVNDPIFLHDKQFRILRCNKAYQQCAGIPFHELIGQPYYEIFPKTGAPLPCCLRVMEKTEAAADEEEMVFGDVTYRSRTFSVYGEQGAYLHSVHILEDITGSRRTEVALIESEEKFHTLYKSSRDAIMTVTPDEGFLGGNPAAIAMFGCRDEQEFTTLTPASVSPEFQPDGRKSADKAQEMMRLAMENGSHSFEWVHKGVDGSEFPADVLLTRTKIGGKSVIQATVRDITGRKRAEEALQRSEKLYRSLFENMLNGFAYCQMIFEQDQPQDFIYLSVNAAFETLTGLKNVDGKRVSEVIPGIRQSDPGLFEIYGRVSLSGKPERFETYVEALQQWFWISVYSPEKGYFVAIFDVITERKKAEETLKKSEALLSEMGRMAKIGGWEFDTRTGQGTWTEEVARIHDMEPWEQASLEIGLGFYQGESRQRIEAAIRVAIADGTPYDLELEMITAKGNHKWVRTIAQPVKEGGKVVRVGGSFQNITERKQAEAAIQHANRALATLGAVNRNLVHATNEDELLQAICQAIVEQRGYRLAWVGYVQHDKNKSIKIMASAGHDEDYLDGMQLTWAETERGMGTSGRTIRSGATQLCQDIASDPLYLPWRDAALKRGYAASIALPLLNGDNTVFGILNVYANEVNAFSPAEIDLLEEMSGDLAFGVRSLHTRHERDLALVQLQDSLEDTVRAIATIVEMRDPYTAGHQVRVADLAAAIARQIELPEEQIHAIHLAGIVHDLGKIQIPAEILSKPGRITDVEFALIKIHPQAGYDILKGINFPWPIAQMVLQHHERMDGSGYPQGLKGDAILLEARILSVADVVEAMSSHRPYRPGLGVETALAEITRQRGSYFDPQIVDACLVLFHEQHYSFKS